jgi:hypothetical protein
MSKASSIPSIKNMNSNKNKNYISETYSVPTDVILEIAKIILQADLLHEIIGVKENKRQCYTSVPAANKWLL